MKRIEFTAGRSCRLDDFLIHDRRMSKRLLTKLKRTENGITRNGTLIRSIDMVEPGDVITLQLEDKSFLEGNTSLDVPAAYESSGVVVFDKPVGMPVHPSIKHQGDTLGNFFSGKYPGLTFRPVNRLDRDTSGLCCCAKDAFSAAALQGNISKVYYAVACGRITGDGVIDAPIAREQDSIIKRIVSPSGQRAVTHYKAVCGNDKYTLLRIILETGRTHQIRVHFAHAGHPLAGDDMYGGSTEDISCQALHCGELTFTEPQSGEVITVHSDIREDMKKLVT